MTTKDKAERLAKSHRAVLDRMNGRLSPTQQDELEVFEAYLKLRTVAEQAYGALVGAHASDDSVQGRARTALKPFVLGGG